MSYDIELFKVEPGETPEQARERINSRVNECDEINPGPSVPEKEALKYRLAEALIAHNPELEIFQFEFMKIAESDGISEEQARSKYRHLELDERELRTGLQILIFDDSASISAPYWHKGKSAQMAFQNIKDCLAIFQKEAGYLAYDPQLGRVLDPQRDFGQAISSYTGIMAVISPSNLMTTLQRIWNRIFNKQTTH